MGSQSSAKIYAELLSNIRQISVVASLSSSADPSTKADISNGGRQLNVTHQGHTESITLPAQTSVAGDLPVAQTGRPSLSWRLPVSPAEAKPAHFSLENQALPWTSVDMKTGSPVGCRNCGSEFVAEGAIETWKDLPSDNWAEMMEFWHCHKPHDHDHQDSESLATKGYGANHAISAQQGVGFVDLTSFLFTESDCRGLKYSSTTMDAGFDMSSLALEDDENNKFLHVFCRKCATEVGLYNIAALSVTLFKWQITCQTNTPDPSPSSPECLAATLMATISRSGSSKSIITPHVLGSVKSDSAVPQQNLHLWVLNPNVVYAASSTTGSKTAMKILYKHIESSEGDKLITSMTSDVQEITLPEAAIKTAEECLLTSSQLLPAQERTFKEWNVGLLGRWEPSS
ncbi:ubiquitin-conjugating enzyme E2-binding protein [Fusarium flagelliforme]|uniref:Ubiquitin-conjugating enzyme E2C-binding protein n=1 Tax=Fusarium flagelliforme TaxID=2675880 RepID=A0A395N0D5_9HYPO|nr:ubiquitin-conjugating enzyme E2-binding protein [Fusarium flagelliforme]KAH7197312.1 ubiquitin-conjugating enzyme E2-binding protein [Fusarium flagelliforme]RFN53365.1 hypothetical protein FIE12Z_2360 [Fusarium flagelliforme]